MKRHITKIIYIASVVLYLLLAFELVGGIMSLNGYELSMDPEILSQNMSYFLASSPPPVGALLQKLQKPGPPPGSPGTTCAGGSPSWERGWRWSWARPRRGRPSAGAC